MRLKQKVEADRWSVIEGRLSIFLGYGIKEKSKLVVPLSMKRESSVVGCYMQ